MSDRLPLKFTHLNLFYALCIVCNQFPMRETDILNGSYTSFVALLKKYRHTHFVVISFNTHIKPIANNPSQSNKFMSN